MENNSNKTLETEPNCEFFDEDEFLNKLEHLKTSKHAIETLAHLIITYKDNHETITQLWFEKLNDVTQSEDKMLALFYLVHEVVKNSKVKNAEIYRDSFRKYLTGSFELARFNRSELIKKQLHQILESWTERGIYEKEFISKLNEILNSSTSESSSLLPYKAPNVSSRHSVDSGISTSQLSNDEDIICLTPSISMPKISLKINPMQIMTSNDPNCAMMKSEMEQFMRINNEILYRRGQYEQMANESKLKETSTKIEYEIKFKEQQLDFKKKLQDIALAEAKNGKIDTALKIYSVINNNKDVDLTLKEEEEIKKEANLRKALKTESKEPDEYDKNRYRHMIYLKCIKEETFDRFKLIYWSKCQRIKDKLCPKAEHFHYIVDVQDYRSHLSSYFKKKQNEDYYKSFQLKDKSQFDYTKDRFRMKPFVNEDDDE